MTALVTPPTSVTPFKDELLTILGPRGVLEPADFEGRSCDPFSDVPIVSSYVARPANTAEVSEIVKLCSRHGVGIVIQGGRTGVCGGAFTAEGTIVISFERMNCIEEICDVDQVAVVQAGVILEALHNAAAEHDLYYPVDLGAKGTATLGGTIATNAGGNHVLRWGMTRQNVLGIEAVLADGTIISAMNRLVKNNTGYDLKHLFIGSEGTLGIVTRAVVKLVPRPQTRSVAFVAVDSMQKVTALLALARKMPSLSAFEVMWSDYYSLMAESRSGRRPLEPGKQYYVLVESMGYDDEFDGRNFERFIEAAGDSGMISDGVVAGSERQANDLWRVREGAEIIVREFGHIVSFDVSVELRSLEAFVADVYQALRTKFPLMRCVTFGHLGDNNIHFGITVGPDTRARTIEVERVVFGVLEHYCGALTAEHGIGQLKRSFLPKHKTSGEMTLMHRLRDGLDHDHLLNRGVLL